jgi:glycosyltransferase involved in cell wall biosynthesis
VTAAASGGEDAMRICFIAPVPPFQGGIAKYCYSLAKELEKRHDLLLLSYARQYPALLYGKKSQIDPDIDKESIRKEFRNLSFDIDSASPGSWRETARRIDAFSPQLVIIPWWVVYWGPMYLYLLLSLKRKGIRVLFLCINVYEHEDTPLKKELTKFVLKRVAHFIVHSEQEKRQILEFHPAARVTKHLLPLFTYSELSLPQRQNDVINLLFFGFVRRYKGLDLLLRALAMLKAEKIKLRVAGQFWKDKEEYLRLVLELGISEMVQIEDGYISDEEMSRYFAGSDLVVLPYKRSITSGVIATAYGFRKPVLATRVGGFHEVIEDGSTGKLVAPDDAQALAEGIRWFIGNRTTDFAGNITRFTAQRMSWSSLVDRIEEFTV